jgi:hypothetical protein
MTSRRTAAATIAILGGLASGARANPDAPQVGTTRAQREDAASVDEAVRRLDHDHDHDHDREPAPPPTTSSRGSQARDTGYAVFGIGLIAAGIGSYLLVADTGDTEKVIGGTGFALGAIGVVVGLVTVHANPRQPVQVGVSATSTSGGLVLAGRW